MLTRIPYELALSHALATRALDAAEQAAIGDAVGRVLAEEIAYAGDLPAFDHAAMDGYAIRGAALVGAHFLVEGESRAGAPLGSALSTDGIARAVAISTGAVMPEGTDTVIPWEDISREGERIAIVRVARAGQHVRHTGEDARSGSLAIARGTRISPRHIALLAALERRSALVARRPRVLVLATGDELRDPGASSGPGLVVDSNGPLLAALVHQAGGAPTCERVSDRPGALDAVLASAGPRFDVIITIGGAAEGEHDHVASALRELGAETIFRGVSIKPGKPVALARLGALPVLALPGNPGSAFVVFTLLGAPLLRAMQGDEHPRPRFVPARLSIAVRGPLDRLGVVYGELTERDHELLFVPGRHAASGSVPGLASASALGLVPAGMTLEAGATIEVLETDHA